MCIRIFFSNILNCTKGHFIFEYLYIKISLIKYQVIRLSVFALILHYKKGMLETGYVILIRHSLVLSSLTNKTPNRARA